MITAVKRLMMVTAAEGIAAVLPENPYAWEFLLHLLMFSRHLLILFQFLATLGERICFGCNTNI